MSHLTPVPSDPDELRAWLAQRTGADPASVLGIPRTPEVDLPPPPDENRALTLELTLLDTDPPVWRRLVVPGNTTLDRVHEIAQAAMGWSDSHLHRFYAGTAETDAHFVTAEDVEEGEEGTLEDQARLDQLLRAVGDSIRYEYDFGDGWEHDIRLSEVGPLGEDSRPRCTDGAGACPPEDVGGVDGYADVAAWVRAGRPRDDVPAPFKSYDDALEWLPLDWHPDAFDVQETDLHLRALAASGELLERLRPEAIGAVLRLSPHGAARVAEWVGAAARTSLSSSDLDELTAPYRILLATLGDGVELTASGYLPPHLVQMLCSALDIHPVLAGKANRENNVLPLRMFREAAQHAGLLRVRGRRLEPTPDGIRLGQDAQAMWQQVSSRLPPGEGELAHDVGWFALLALAGGVVDHEVYDVVHELCVDSGWVGEDDQPIDFHTVNQLVWPTQAALLGASWNSLRPRPSWLPAAAASVIFSDALG